MAVEVRFWELNVKDYKFVICEKNKFAYSQLTMFNLNWPVTSKIAKAWLELVLYH